MLEKVCTYCNITHPIEDFDKHSPSISGRYAWCKTCRALRNKEAHWRRAYKLSPEDVAHLYNDCNRCCEVCGLHEISTAGVNNNSRTLNIDHCHNTGNVRGLLCFNCNAALGKARDSIEVLTNLISYLQRKNNLC